MKTENSRGGRGACSERRALKRALFRRDGWEEGGRWYALCAFGCGTTLVSRDATIDRYPVPGRFGGRYTPNNTRLACGPCNWADGGKHVQPPHERAQPSIRKLSKKEAQQLEQLRTRKLRGSVDVP